MNPILDMMIAVRASNRDDRLALACLPLCIAALGVLFCGWAP